MLYNGFTLLKLRTWMRVFKTKKTNIPKDYDRVDAIKGRKNEGILSIL